MASAVRRIKPESELESEVSPKLKKLKKDLGTSTRNVAKASPTQPCMQKDGVVVCCFCKKPSIPGDVFYELLEEVKWLGKNNKQNINWVHNTCNYYTGRKCAQESFGQTWSRANQLKCKLCNLSGPHIGCFVGSCKNIYHFPCAMTSGGEITSETFYCSKHLTHAIEGTKE
eukprot:TRINITY_DN14982_c0_g1_i1.p1 TRINITY_DN14982_c0_g1~~TRINITY_DN14982_c0_g1_i1.p1  ORF type:complete len:171 (+),score=19.81 TRINITY_DN14982_c0_g1_i1:11-523(+)